MQIKVKICGITQYEDARAAVNLGADAIGFVFDQKNPRYIEPYKVNEIIKKLPPFITKVGIFCDEIPQTITEIASSASIDTIQLNGSEPPETIAQLSMPIIKTFFIEPGFDIGLLEEYNVSAFLIDTWSKMKKAGSRGNALSRGIAQKVARLKKNVILSGGLGLANIKEALEEVEPYAVDVCESVEVSPGIKNPQKMRDIIKTVKGWKYKEGP